MKVLHIPYTWRPEPFGGTEHYVLGLVRALGRLGVEGVVAAAVRRDGEPAQGNASPGEPREYAIDPGDPSPGLFREESYGRGSRAMARQLSEIASSERVSLVHFHSYTRLASAEAARQVAALGLPYVVSFHTPTLVCLRGDLRLEGEGPCDGRMDPRRCSRCWLRFRGVPRPASTLLSWLDPPLLPGRLGGLLAARGLVASRSSSVREFLRGAGAVIALCEWGLETLRRNGVDERQLVLARHGLDDDLLQKARVVRANTSERRPLTFVFVGRADPVKGADLFVEAMKRLPGEELRAVLFVVVQGARDEETLRHLHEIAGGDARIRIESGISRERVLEELAAAAALVVPSRCLETGPLVVLEAFAAGTPVVGARVGGIAELVHDERDGLLFELGDVGGLTKALSRVASDSALRSALRAGVLPPRAMSDVARQMNDLYRSVSGPRAASPNP